VLDSGWVVQGPEVAAFEKAVGVIHQLPHAVAVSSATAGLHLMYLALGIGPGDVVLIPSFAWPSAANMAARVGATPFFVDVAARTANLTAQTLERGLQQVRARGLGNPRAVVVVHEFGLPAPMAEILEVARAEDLIVLEDAACALGAIHDGQPLGHFGRMTVFSFHPRKSVSTGEGGVVVTNEPALADAVRASRNHGQETLAGRREFTSAGFNYRLTELQAAVGLAQLKRLPGILGAKKKLAALYFEQLEDLRQIRLPANDPEHTWQTFMITLASEAERVRVQEFCKTNGIETGPGSVAGHRAAFWGNQFLEPEDLCSVSTRLATCGLALPLHPRLTEAEVARVTTALRTALSNAD
jgi:dTDP-4-amino-4,6-dideoxygalactose transaminase